MKSNLSILMMKRPLRWLPVLLGLGACATQSQDQHPATADKPNIIQQELRSKEPTLELYSLTEDPQETHNVAADHPEIIEQATEIFKQEHTEPTIDRFKISALEAGLVGQ